MPAQESKAAIYAKRNAASIPAPLESDSDSDFNAGVYIPEPTIKKRKKGSRTARTSRKNRNKRSGVLDDIEPTLIKKTRKDKEDAFNPLLEYFNVEELDLHSASEEEEAPEDSHDGESEEERSNEEDSHDQPAILKTLACILPKQPVPVDGDESVTESDDEIPIPVVPPKRKSPSSSQVMPLAKRARLVPEEDESVTESDDDFPVPDGINTTTKLPSVNSDSETEPETDPEQENIDIQSLEPKPNFPRSTDPSLLVSLVLDQKENIAVPSSINTFLREYQRDGIKFFWRQYQQGRGGLLGDDMGLGKTIQVISFLSAIMKKFGDKRDLDRRRNHVSALQDGSDWRQRHALPPADATWPTCLIIAPSTVVHNWEREFQVWGYFEVGIFTGPRKERDPVLNDFKLGRLDVVLTSFDIARNEMDLLEDLPWSCVIVDEVHRVKNPRSETTRSLNRFDCLRRFGLTGTTIQNDYMEMWTILDWTNPKRLGTPSQWRGFVKEPLTTGQSAQASEVQKAKSQAVALILRDKLLPNFFIRRTKDIIKDQLPTKTDQVVFCPLTPTQITVYKRILNVPSVQDLLRRDEECDCGSGRQRKKCCHPVDPATIFTYMSILIKISNHLALILPSPFDTPEQTIKNRELSELAFPDETLPKYGTAMLKPHYCGKWAVLEALLKEWHRDRSNKVLIFTKSVKLLEMLDFHLGNNGYGFVKLHGGTKQSERMPMIDRFHRDPDVFVFLISTLAGGTGLNLTGANKVVILDPNWNPAHDLQAMDRAYRFGQTRDVFVYRLLGAGSLEELIYARQLYKQQQMAIGYQASVQTRYFQGVQSDASRQGELFGIQNIFKLHEGTLATKMAIENASLAEFDWALANINGKTKKKGKANANEWALEVDASATKEDSDLRGLGALLFDEDVPSTTKKEKGIEASLSAIGVKYSHRNDDILLPSRVEEQRAQEIKKRQRKKARISSDARTSKVSKTPEPEWPPKRSHHQAPPGPESRLQSRQAALIELGMINYPAELPIFAHNFVRKSKEEQLEIFSRLDEYAQLHKPDF